jgi:hypothetical protein
MKRPLTPLGLGTNILIVLDECPACLDMLQTMVACLGSMPQKDVSLLYCCSAFSSDLTSDWTTEERQFQFEQHYLYQATDILHTAGVSASHIHIARAIGQKCLAAAVAMELKRKPYTGLIVRNHYHQVARRLQHSGLMDEFGRIANIVVWAMPVDAVLTAKTS